ncbi:MAG TPA: hypothetical protein PKK11_00355 [Methanothrix sp.]|nr:hypothetical protein [Methanothrix sp.]
MSEKGDTGDAGSEKTEDAGEKEQIIREEDEHGCLLVYPAWSKKNAPAENKSKWDVPVYL